jgi:invasion protein IalB
MAPLKTARPKTAAGHRGFRQVIGLAAATFLYSTPLQATPLNSWEYHCVIEDGSSEEVCTTELRSQDKDTEAIFYFARGPKGPVPFVALSETVPFGALKVQVDDEAPLKADSCEDGVCYFEAEKSRLLLQQFRSGRSAHIVIDAPDGRNLFDADITLIGFTAAYKLY